MKRALLAAFPAAGVLIASACGGGGSGAVPHAPAQQGRGAFSVRVSIPGSGSVASAKTAAARRAFSAASSTSGILFTVYAHGGSPSSPLATSGADISSSSTYCQPSGTGRTCMVPLASPAGVSVDILAQTYDQVIPTSGTVPAGAHLLASGVAGAQVATLGQNNSVNLTANPVLSTVSMLATPSLVHTLVPATVSIAVDGFDAGGNLILAGSYVDANGNAVSASIALGSNPNNSLSLGTSTFSGSGGTTTLTYNGASNTSGSLSIVSAAPFASTLNIGLLAPTVYTIPDANLAGSSGGFQGIAPILGGGSAPNYVMYATPSNFGASFVNAGSNNSGFTGIPASQAPTVVPTTQPVFGDILYDSQNQTHYFGSTSSATMTQIQYLSGSPPTVLTAHANTNCTSSPPVTCNVYSQMAYSWSSGTVFYGDGQGITQWNNSFSTNAVRLQTLTGTHVWAGAYWDYIYPTHRLWMADSNSTVYEVDTRTPSGGLFSSNFIYAGTTFTGGPWGVTADPITHNGWATFPQAKLVAEYTDPINTTTPTTFATSGTPEYITVSYGDAIWFTETTANGLTLGRIDLTTNVLTEYPLIANMPGGQAGPIINMGYVPCCNLNAGTELGIVFYSGSASPGDVLLVIP